MEFNTDLDWFPTESLKKAYDGYRPDQLDNSTFVKVDASYAGQTLVEVNVGEKYHIFTQDGKPVKSKAKKWLCWAKWDPKNDPAKR